MFSNTSMGRKRRGGAPSKAPACVKNSVEGENPHDKSRKSIDSKISDAQFAECTERELP